MATRGTLAGACARAGGNTHAQPRAVSPDTAWRRFMRGILLPGLGLGIEVPRLGGGRATKYREIRPVARAGVTRALVVLVQQLRAVRRIHVEGHVFANAARVAMGMVGAHRREV